MWQIPLKNSKTRVPLAVLALGLIALTVTLAQCTAAADAHRAAELEQEAERLQTEADHWRDVANQLSQDTASGGGVNVKMMPHPESGEPTIALQEVFTFDRRHALCRVDTNPEAFKMPTYQMGEVVIEAHHFYMSMVAETIETYQVTTDADGRRRVTMRGQLDCATEVQQADGTIGSRDDPEHATYLIEAIDGGAGGGPAGDSFAFTAFFDPVEAPINYAIFGPEFTFTGEMVEGEITILDPAALSGP